MLQILSLTNSYISMVNINVFELNRLRYYHDCSTNHRYMSQNSRYRGLRAYDERQVRDQYEASVLQRGRVRGWSLIGELPRSRVGVQTTRGVTQLQRAQLRLSNRAVTHNEVLHHVAERQSPHQHFRPVVCASISECTPKNYQQQYGPENHHRRFGFITS